MRATAILFLLVLFLGAEERQSVLEKIVQPKVSYTADFLRSSALSGTDATLQTTRHALRINNKIIGFQYHHWRFKWDGVEHLPFGDGQSYPIRSMHRLSLRLNLPNRISDQWFWLTSLNINATFEREMDNAYGLGLFSFGSYRIDEDHALQLGAFANYHPTKSLMLPAIGYSYRAKARDGFKAVIGFPRAYVGYHLHENLLLRAGMLFSQAVIRLADDSTIAPQGFIEAKDYMGNAGIRYDFSDRLQIDADLRYAFIREFTRYDADANEIGHDTIEPSWGMMLKIQYLI